MAVPHGGSGEHLDKEAQVCLVMPCRCGFPGAPPQGVLLHGGGPSSPEGRLGSRSRKVRDSLGHEIARVLAPFYGFPGKRRAETGGRTTFDLAETERQGGP